MFDGDVFRMSEAANAAELAGARVARKQTNKCRAAEELAKSAATATQQHAADATAASEQEALVLAAEEVCFKNVNAALLQNQDFRFFLATK